MSIFQFFRILWAHRLLIALCGLTTLIVATVVVSVVPPKYQAQSRAILEVIKPDPVTGQVIASAYLRAYTKTQIELIKDQQVARKVVKELDWANDPKLQREYRDRSGDLDLDFTAWAARKIMSGAGAGLLAGSNILEISYSTDSPTRAKQVADALLKAYMDITLESRRATARRNAQWYEAQAEKTRSLLYQAETTKAQFERESGIVLQDDKSDIDSARLQALASQGSAPIIAAAPGVSPAEAQLAGLDAEIAEAAKTLGPSHPQLQQMRMRRSLLVAQAARERNLAGASAGAAANAARATAGMLEQQKAKVMAQREKLEKLRLMQDEIDLRREQYKGAVARAAQLRQEADVADAGVTPLASAVTPQSPVFPNKPMIMGASLPAGAAAGILLSLLLELISRRIRSAEDLTSATTAPVLAVIRRPGNSDEPPNLLRRLLNLRLRPASRVARA